VRLQCARAHANGNHNHLGRVVSAHVTHTSWRSRARSSEVSGTYHYHSVTSCVRASDTPGQHSPLVGYAKDGFGLYGNLGEDGKVLTNADLDECHGHAHAIVWNGALTTLYHYHATREYPYTLGCYRGHAVP
jgi:YHYH protein